MKRSILLAAALMALCCASARPQTPAKKPGTKAGAAKARPKPVAPPAEPLHLAVAEGRYELKRTDHPLERSFAEQWTLFKTDLGFELVEQWIVGAGGGQPETIIDVKVQLAPGLHPTEVRIGGDDSARQLDCHMELKEFRCNSGGVESKMVLEGAYNFFSPSPWMLGSIARRAKKVPNESTQVHLVRMGGMTESGPKLGSFIADVQYVGEDTVTVNGEKMDAIIYEIKSQQAIPSMQVWLSPEGVVLQMQDSTKPEQKMELTEYKKLAKF